MRCSGLQEVVEASREIVSVFDGAFFMHPEAPESGAVLMDVMKLRRLRDALDKLDNSEVGEAL